jgi:hypothetical protein
MGLTVLPPATKIPRWRQHSIAQSTTPTPQTTSDELREQRVPFTEVWSVLFGDCPPVRDFPSYKGQRHFNGRWWTAAEGEALGWCYEIAGVPPVSLLKAGLPVHVRMLREPDGTRARRSRGRTCRP